MSDVLLGLVILGVAVAAFACLEILDDIVHGRRRS